MIGTLVRFWENGLQNEVATAWVDWEDGWFHLNADSELGDRVFDAAVKQDLLLTVYSTEELVWTVSSTEVRWGYQTVHCVPWLTRLKHSLVSDDYMVHLWLKAEENYELGES